MVAACPPTYAGALHTGSQRPTLQAQGHPRPRRPQGRASCPLAWGETEAQRIQGQARGSALHAETPAVHFTDDPVGDPGLGWHQQDTEPPATSWSPGWVAGGFRLLCGLAPWWRLCLGWPWADRGAFTVAAWPSAPRKQCPQAWGLPPPAGAGLPVEGAWLGRSWGAAGLCPPPGTEGRAGLTGPLRPPPAGSFQKPSVRSAAYSHMAPDPIRVPSLSLKRDGSDMRGPRQPSALAPSGPLPAPHSWAPCPARGRGHQRQPRFWPPWLQRTGVRSRPARSAAVGRRGAGEPRPSSRKPLR